MKTKATELNISSQALEQIEILGYFIVDKKLVLKDFLDKYQLTDRALEIIGYKIVWNGLVPIKIIEDS